MGSNPVRAWIYFKPYIHYYLTGSAHNCDDRFYIRYREIFAHNSDGLHANYEGWEFQGQSDWGLLKLHPFRNDRPLWLSLYIVVKSVCSLAFSCSCLLPFTTSLTKKKGVVLSFRELFFLHEKPSAVTSSPSYSCEVNILRNESHGEHMRVWMRIPLLDGKTTFRNNKIRQTLNKNTSPYFHSALLVLWPLAF